MSEINWLQMLAYQQELHHFSRALLAQRKKQTLTASELEVLSRLYLRLYLQTENSTPLWLSQQSGMKKEAVSRCLKQLLEKGFISKDKHPQDERSYVLSLTESGKAALRENYGPILQPLYDLQRSMGTEFDTLFQLIEKANAKMDAINKK